MTPPRSRSSIQKSRSRWRRLQKIRLCRISREQCRRKPAKTAIKSASTRRAGGRPVHSRSAEEASGLHLPLRTSTTGGNVNSRWLPYFRDSRPNGAVLGIGGFESPQPPLPNGSSPHLGSPVLRSFQCRVRPFSRSRLRSPPPVHLPPG